MTKPWTRLLHPLRSGRYSPLRNRWLKFRGKPYTYVSPDGGFAVYGALGEYDVTIGGHEFHVIRTEFKPFRFSGPVATEAQMNELGWTKVGDDE